jgi:AcrR family transcriptional regulator
VPNVRTHTKGPGTPGLNLDVARELFAAEGYEAVTMKRIADQLGITPTAIYFHFADKAALIQQLTAADWAAFAQKFARATAEPDPIARLRLAARGYIEFARTHPNQYQLLFMARRKPEEIAARDAGLEVHAMIETSVQEALAAGRLRPQFTNAKLITQALWAAVHGVAALYIIKHDAPGAPFRHPQRTAEIAVEALLVGLLAP